MYHFLAFLVYLVLSLLARAALAAAYCGSLGFADGEIVYLTWKVIEYDDAMTHAWDATGIPFLRS